MIHEKGRDHGNGRLRFNRCISWLMLNRNRIRIHGDGRGIERQLTYIYWVVDDYGLPEKQ
jgi:hypothetical protein